MSEQGTYDGASKITQKTRLPKEGKTIIIQAFNYSRMYEFDDSYDIATGKCNPRDLIIFLLRDYEMKLIQLADNILCKQIGTGKTCKLYAKLNTDCKNGCFVKSLVLSPKDAPEFLESDSVYKPFPYGEQKVKLKKQGDKIEMIYKAPEHKVL